VINGCRIWLAAGTYGTGVCFAAPENKHQFVSAQDAGAAAQSEDYSLVYFQNDNYAYPPPVVPAPVPPFFENQYSAIEMFNPRTGRYGYYALDGQTWQSEYPTSTLGQPGLDFTILEKLQRIETLLQRSAEPSLGVSEGFALMPGNNDLIFPGCCYVDVDILTRGPGVGRNWGTQDSGYFGWICPRFVGPRFGELSFINFEQTQFSFVGK
jgi:hypothetical protein